MGPWFALRGKARPAWLHLPHPSHAVTMLVPMALTFVAICAICFAFGWEMH